ncbi:MAG: hypothetical protein ACPGO3_09185 [Magnetospiraceae bacterium]
MAKKISKAAPGDIYIRRENPNSRWIVDRLIDPANHPPHVLLRKVGREATSITVALSVLQDPAEFSKLATPDKAPDSVAAGSS